jgi:hypothetical protein
MAPTVQKAVVIQQDGSVALREVAVPKPGPDEILVKVVAAAQNPADCESYFLTIHIICDYFFIQQYKLNLSGFCQGRAHCGASALEQSPGATTRGLSRRSGRTSRKVCAR